MFDKNTTNQESQSVMRETNTNLTDNTNTPRFKNLSVKSVFENPTHHAMTLFSVASEPYPLNSCNPCSKKPTHHASISIYAFPQNNNPCYPCNPCSKKPTHHASISIYAFPKNKIRAIRVIRVQENNPSRININLRVPPKIKSVLSVFNPLPITESKRRSVFYLTHSTQFSFTSPSLYCVICRLWFT